jgi:hypothetical protein
MAANFLNPGSIETSVADDQMSDEEIRDNIKPACLKGSTLPASLCRYFLEMDRGFEVKYVLHINGTVSHPLIKKCFEEDFKIRDNLLYYSKFHFSEREFDLDTIRQEINVNKPCLVPLKMGKKDEPHLHWVLLLGFYSSQHNSYCAFADPADGIIESCTTDKFEKKMNLANGKLFISVWI